MSGEKELKPGQPVLEKIWLGYTEKVFYKPMLFPDLASANAWKERAPKNYGEVFIKQYNLAGIPPGVEVVPEGTEEALHMALDTMVALANVTTGVFQSRDYEAIKRVTEIVMKLAAHRATQKDKETGNAAP